MPTKIILHSDGAAKGNPGPSGIGVALYHPGEKEPFATFAEYIGETTNNVAEYRGLLRGLEEALLRGADEIEARTDSELMARQIAGRYKVASPDLLPLFEAARRLLGKFDKAQVVHVPRAKNAMADKLANQGIAERAGAAKPKPAEKAGKEKADKEQAVERSAEAPIEATEAADITTDDLAVMERIAGREATEEQRQLMAKPVSTLRDALKAIRLSEFADGTPAFHFDPIIAGTALPTGESRCTLSDAPPPDYGGDPETLAFRTVAELARLIQARKVTALELTQLYLARLKKFGPRLLCVVSLCEESALWEAALADAEIADGRYRGPLHGIPYGLKDLFAAKGTKTTFGAEPYAEQFWDFDSPVAARLRDAGAILVAKLSMGELAMGDVWFGGTTRNPWKPEMGSSGSSAGSASATAAGLVGFAIGTETLGSIVSPCVVCGTSGLRPTFGRVPRTGGMPLSWTMDKVGPICRGVEDLALVFAAIHGPDGQDHSCLQNVPFAWDANEGMANLRIGMDKTAFDRMGEDERGKNLLPAYQEALTILQRMGVALVPISLPEKNAAYEGISRLTIGAEGAASFARLRAEGGLERLKQQEVWNWPTSFRVGATIPAADYIQAQRVRSHLQRAMADALQEVDVYVTFPWFGPSLNYTNLTGHPTVITRCGKTDDGLPVMIEFTAALCREDAALRLALRLRISDPMESGMARHRTTAGNAAGNGKRLIYGIKIRVKYFPWKCKNGVVLIPNPLIALNDTAEINRKRPSLLFPLFAISKLTQAKVGRGGGRSVRR